MELRKLDAGRSSWVRKVSWSLPERVERPRQPFEKWASSSFVELVPTVAVLFAMTLAFCSRSDGEWRCEGQRIHRRCHDHGRRHRNGGDSNDLLKPYGICGEHAPNRSWRNDARSRVRFPVGWQGGA